MAAKSTLRFGAQTDEVTSLLRIVNLVRLGEATTRPELGQVTGLGRGVVSQRVDQAMQLGFLSDGVLAQPRGGRAPRTLQFSAGNGRLVTLALGAMHMRVGICDLVGDITHHAHRDWDISRGPAETMDAAFPMIDALLAEAGEVPIWGIAVGLPGPVDFTTGSAVAPPIMPGWSGFEVPRRFEQRYGAPTWADNDVNLLAFAERARRREVQPDLIYCKVGTGIGAGLLSQGRIHRGAKGAAGDIGHEPVAGSTELCRCGRVGCLEAVAGGWALVRDARSALEAGATGYLARWVGEGQELTPELITRAARDGDVLAIALVRNSASHVGQVLAGLVNLFNPAVIVAGGVVAASVGEVYLAELRQRIFERANPLATVDLSIERSPNDPREPLRGGAEMVREQLFDITFARWFADGRPSPQGVQWRPLEP